MHLVCIEVMKKMLLLLVKRNAAIRLRKDQLATVNEKLIGRIKVSISYQFA